jgi:hypothetical protein
LSDDAVVDALVALAPFVFPVLQAATIESEQWGSHLEIALFRHAGEWQCRDEYKAATAAIAADARLAQLVVGDNELGPFIRDNTGRGWRLQYQQQFPEAFLRAALRSAEARGAALDTVEVLTAELPRVVKDVSALLAGEDVEVAQISAFRGLALPDDATIETPWGVLRPASPTERAWHPFSPMSPTIVLVSSLQLHWDLGEGEATISDELLATNDAEDHLALSALLALGRDAVVRPLWATVVAPLGFGQGFRGRARPEFALPGFDPPPPDPLMSEQRAELAEWTSRVAQSYHSSIAVAVRRTLSAVSEREAEDALIDAVIAWENLFGKGSNVEMVFRITTAVSRLLKKDPAERRDLQKELSKIYGLRSKVAHGDEAKPKDKLGERRDRAVEVALEALRVLFRDEPALLADTKRGLTVLLR